MRGIKVTRFLASLGILALYVSGAGGPETPGREGARAFTLEEVISLGIERNPRVAAAALTADARRAAYQAARRFENPELEFSLGRAESHDRLTSRDTFGLSVSQRVENPLKRRHRLEAARKDWEEARQSQARIVLEESCGIKTRFYSLLYLERQEVLLEKIADSVREMHRLIEIRAEMGEARPLDAVKLLVEALQAEMELAALRAEGEETRGELNILLGGALPPDFHPDGELAFHPLPLAEEALLEHALAGHPRILEKRTLAEGAQSRVLFVKAQRFPDLTLKGFSDSGLDGLNRGVQFGLAVPLWNFRGRELAEATSLFLREEKELEAARLELAAEVRACLRRVRLAEETLAVFTGATLGQVEQSLGIAEAGYREGEISLLEYLDTQRTYNRVLGDYHRALLAWNTEMAALEKAAGAALR